MPVTDQDSSFTRLLQDWRSGHKQAFEKLIDRVYADLLRIAHRQMRGERNGHPLQTTAVVHEACLRLLELERIDWRDRAHFFSTMASIMRRLLIDEARSKLAGKRGGHVPHVALSDALPATAAGPEELLDLELALRRLSEIQPELGRLVELRCFAGCSIDEIADSLDMSPATVKRRWAYARTWLYRELLGSANDHAA